MYTGLFNEMDIFAVYVLPRLTQKSTRYSDATLPGRTMSITVALSEWSQGVIRL